MHWLRDTFLTIYIYRFLQDPAGFVIGLMRSVIDLVVYYVKIIPVIILLALGLYFTHVSNSRIKGWNKVVHHWVEKVHAL